MSEASKKELAELLAKVCPSCQSATLVLSDSDGTIVGYGRVVLGERGADITITPQPEGCRLLGR